MARKPIDVNLLLRKNRFIKVMNWHGALQKAVGKCEILSLIHLSVVLFFVGS